MTDKYDLKGKHHSVPCANDCCNDKCKCVCHKPLKIKIENCGRWFDDYVLYQGKELIGIWSSAKKIPSKYRKQLASQILAKDKITPDEAKFFLEFGS